jgi:hypothetical protein
VPSLSNLIKMALVQNSDGGNDFFAPHKVPVDAPQNNFFAPNKIGMSEDPASPTPMSGLTVSTPRSQQAPPDQKDLTTKAPTNYNNVDAVKAIQDVTKQYPEMPHTGTLSSLVGTHGTLRDVIGTIGDAFLVHAGKDPVYQQAKQRQQIANAAAGFEQDPAAAASRIAASGAPDSMSTAQKMYDEYQTEQLRKQQQEYTNEYRKSVHDDKANQQLSRLTPYVGAIVNDPRIQTKDDYQRAYDRATAMARRIDPQATGADLGLIDPQDWEPGMGSTVGMTQGQNVRNQYNQSSLTERAREANMRNSTTIRGQDVNASTAGQRDATTRRGQDMTDARSKNKTKLSIPGLTVPNGGGGGATQGQLTPQQAAKLPSGTRFQGTNGKWYVKH